MFFYFRQLPFFVYLFLACFLLSVTAAHSQGKEEYTESPKESPKESFELLAVEPITDNHYSPESGSTTPLRNNGHNNRSYMLNTIVPTSTASWDTGVRTVSLPIRLYNAVRQQNDSCEDSGEPDECPEHSGIGACNCNSSGQKSNNANTITSQPEATTTSFGSPDNLIASDGYEPGGFALTEIPEEDMRSHSVLPPVMVYGKESLSVLVALLQSLERGKKAYECKLSGQGGFQDRYCDPLADCNQPTIVKFWGVALLSLAVGPASLTGAKYALSLCENCCEAALGSSCQTLCFFLAPLLYGINCSCATYIAGATWANNGLKPVALKIRLRHRLLTDSHQTSLLTTEITQRLRRIISRLCVRDEYPFIRAIRTISSESGAITETHLTIEALVPAELTSINALSEYLNLDIVNNEAGSEAIVIQPGVIQPGVIQPDTTRPELEPDSQTPFLSNMFTGARKP